MLREHRKAVKRPYLSLVQMVYSKRRTPSKLTVVSTYLATKGPIPVAAYTIALKNIRRWKPVWRIAMGSKS